MEGYLRPMDQADLELVWRWRNREHIREVMMNPQPISRDEHERWFAALQEKKHILPYLYVEEQKPLGFVSFSRIDTGNGLGYWGFYLGAEHTKPGTGTRMCEAAIRLAFQNLGIRKLCAEVLGHNHKSLHLHKKLGFSPEGTLKKHRRIGEGYADVHLFAIFNPKGEHRGLSNR